MEQKSKSLSKIGILVFIGLTSAIISSLLVHLGHTDKDGIFPWGGMTGALATNAGLHINLWFRGYKIVDLDKYTYSSILFVLGTMMFVYGAIMYLGLLMNFVWPIWIFSYLFFLKNKYSIEKPDLAMTLCAVGVFLSAYTSIGGGIDDNLWKIAFFFSSSITVLYPLLIPNKTVPNT